MNHLLTYLLTYLLNVGKVLLTTRIYWR